MAPQQPTDSVEYNASNPEPPSGMRSIFRAEALKHYQENQEKVVLPPLVSPRIFRTLWLLGGLLALAGLFLAFWPWMGALMEGLP